MNEQNQSFEDCTKAKFIVELFLKKLKTNPKNKTTIKFASLILQSDEDENLHKEYIIYHANSCFSNLNLFVLEVKTSLLKFVLLIPESGKCLITLDKRQFNNTKSCQAEIKNWREVLDEIDKQIISSDQFDETIYRNLKQNLKLKEI